MEETIKYYPVLDNFKCVTFSDTHNLHEGVKLPKCDIAIFNGDYSGRGNKFETLNFLRWYNKQDQCKYKVMVPGNHDICFDPRHNGETHSQNWLDNMKKQFSNIIILNNNMVDIENVKIWGSPVTPWYHGERWGHNMHEDEIHKIWETIPPNIDIVVTHGPVYGILDKVTDLETKKGKHVGCKILKDVLINRVKPQFHLCGHIHEGYGSTSGYGTVFINSSIVDLEYERVNEPIKFMVGRIDREYWNRLEKEAK